MILYLHIEAHQINNIFRDIKDRLSFLSVKLKCLEYMKTCWHGNVDKSKPYICLDTELDRVFLVNQDARKVVSFVFGYNIKVTDEDLTKATNAISRIGYKNQDCEITEKMISECQSILSDLSQRADNIYWSQDMSIDESGEEMELSSIRLFEHMLMQETGYLRYDDDPEKEKLPYHPRYHIDVNYSNNAHYKIGLGKQTTIEEMIYMLNKKTKCPYLQIEHSKYDIVAEEPIKRRKKKRK